MRTVILAALVACAPAVPAAAEQQLAALPAVLDELRSGGMVIYLRHAATDRSQKDSGVDLARCETQRNLSDAGRDQARNIGAAFAALDIPIGTILSSPFCRVRDTAQLAFGRHEVSNDLYFAVSADKNDVKRMTESLRRMLSTRPTDGTNTIVVSHTANLREAAGIWPDKEGVAIIFRPLGNGRFEPVARVPAEAWSAASTPRSGGAT
jgi:phosphohistidine phosphatase SixA